VPVFALVLVKSGVAKGPSAAGDPDCESGMEENVRRFSCRHTTMQSLADRLPVLAPGYFSLAVVDRTGWKGEFDFKLSYVARGPVAPGAEGGALSLFKVIEKQLGVRAENQTASMPVVTIEAVNRVPSENPPGVLEKLGAAPTEFEVAMLRPSRPAEEEDANVSNGRIEATALSLNRLRTAGWLP
jgi:uncharacterized protein (TIGR03435 family)